ncbi:enhanced intracellular survival protein Eis [Actinokineospora guangxiensis]|uniref:Enhanced intracellular survival protein Eis n=1 Tax=Actinokineospora guangxiensis TaxID=1490288 RepID=A0ABW0EI66_9PSEU
MSVRPFAESDTDAFQRLRRLAFSATDGLGSPQAWSGLVAEDASGVVGALRAWDYRQFFGGRAVPCGGVASVVVLPHVGGQGVARDLLRASVRMMREAGQPVSALYPTVPAVYQRHGWEQVGALERLPVPIDVLTRLRPELPVRPAAESDLPALHAAYLRTAARVDGMLDRCGPAFTLGDVLDLDFVHVVEGRTGLRGYLTADRRSDALVVHDVIADDATTATALLASLGSWSSVAAEVTLRLIDPAVELLLARTATAIDVHPWMLRVVDLPAAVAARGWPAVSSARPFAVDIEITDSDAPWHAGRHRLVWDGEKVTCEPGGSGDVRLGPRGLAAWFACAADTHTLRRAGLLTGGPADGLDTLTGGRRLVRMADEF